jgi:hypothetical protein
MINRCTHIRFEELMVSVRQAKRGDQLMAIRATALNDDSLFQEEKTVICNEVDSRFAKINAEAGYGKSAERGVGSVEYTVLGVLGTSNSELRTPNSELKTPDVSAGRENGQAGRPRSHQNPISKSLHTSEGNGTKS